VSPLLVREGWWSVRANLVQVRLRGEVQDALAWCLVRVFRRSVADAVVLLLRSGARWCRKMDKNEGGSRWWCSLVVFVATAVVVQTVEARSCAAAA